MGEASIFHWLEGGIRQVVLLLFPPGLIVGISVLVYYVIRLVKKATK